MIVLVIKTYFFTGTNSYGLGRKPHMSHFFHPFGREMIRVVCTMLVIAIEDLGVRLSNLTLPIGKSAIRFEPLVQKGKTSEQIANAIYFFYLFANKFIGAYARLEKTWAKTSLPCQDRIIAILRKRVFKQVVEGARRKSEIVEIPN